MDILANQKKIIKNQERILERLPTTKSGDQDPWKPNEAQNTDGVMWSTEDTPSMSQENPLQRMQQRQCEFGCAASLRREGVTDLSTFYDKCVLDGGDVLLSTLSSEISVTDGAESLISKYARALESDERPIVRCSASVTESDVCDVWNAEISKCLSSQSSNKS